MSAFIHHFSFEFRTGIRNRSLLLMLYLFPLAVYLILGALMTAVNPTFRETMIPAMIIFAILAGALLSLPDPLVAARTAGIFRSYKINGVPAFSILIIPAMAAFVHLAVTGAIITATAPLLFDAPLPVHWPAFALVFVLMTAACAALGLLIGVISASSQMAVLWAQLIFLPSMILGGLMLPTSMLPGALARLAMLLPTTYGMNAFRGLAQDLETSFSPVWSLAVLLSGAILAFGLALYLFRWNSDKTTGGRRPLLALIALLPYVLGMIFLA